MRRPVIAIVAAVAVLGLAGCSKAAQSAPLSSTDQTSAVPGATGGPGTGGVDRGRFPGVSGLVAAVTGSTAQVQGPTQQTAVTWTSTTRFTDQVAVSPAALAVGECVMARPARPAGSPTDTTGAPGATTSTAAPAPTTPVAAATVELFAKQGTMCSLGAGARTGTGQAGTPSGSPGGSASGPTAGARRAFGAVGMITAVGTGEFTVSPTVRPGAMPTRPVTVTYTSSTVFTRLDHATASAVRVGVCLSAQGRTDDTGALTASAVSVSTPSNGTCVTGIGRGNRPAPGTGTGRG